MREPNFHDAAVELCNFIVSAGGGPLMDKRDAVLFAEKYLREIYHRGRSDLCTHGAAK